MSQPACATVRLPNGTGIFRFDFDANGVLHYCWRSSAFLPGAVEGDDYYDDAVFVVAVDGADDGDDDDVGMCGNGNVSHLSVHCFQSPIY